MRRRYATAPLRIREAFVVKYEAAAAPPPADGALADAQGTHATAAAAPRQAGIRNRTSRPPLCCLLVCETLSLSLSLPLSLSLSLSFAASSSPFPPPSPSPSLSRIRAASSRQGGEYLHLAAPRQAGLGIHRDGTLLNCVLLLSDPADFDGGGGSSRRE